MPTNLILYLCPINYLFLFRLFALMGMNRRETILLPSLLARVQGRWSDGQSLLKKKNIGQQ